MAIVTETREFYCFKKMRNEPSRCVAVYISILSWCSQAKPDPRKKEGQDRLDNLIFMVWVELPTVSTMLGIATTVLSDYYELAVGVSYFWSFIIAIDGVTVVIMTDCNHYLSYCQIQVARTHNTVTLLVTLQTHLLL